MSEWINVEDRLPSNSLGKEYDEYITYCCNNEHHDPIVTVLSWTGSRWIDNNYNYWCEFVTHWMLLPEPPKTKPQ